MLSSLHQEHVNIAKLLALLKRKLLAIRAEEKVSYRLIRDVVDYLGEVADKRHHPKEDMIYDYYLRYRVVDGDMGNRLHEEHQKLIDSGRELKEMVEMILLDAVIPLEQFTAKLEQFITLQENHMNYEERVVFPLLRESLTEDDWRHLEQSWLVHAQADPLFGPEVAQHFHDLAERLALH
ncbi:hemerythrin domain-containing protein [Aeromonas diversa]|uniref:hemerythrin domain-containing protein n=1 Tax=Aeromonas diversa TaxID=502790 RepID=UPI0039A20304